MISNIFFLDPIHCCMEKEAKHLLSFFDSGSSEFALAHLSVPGPIWVEELYPQKDISYPQMESTSLRNLESDCAR